MTSAAPTALVFWIDNPALPGWAIWLVGPPGLDYITNLNLAQASRPPTHDHSGENLFPHGENHPESCFALLHARVGFFDLLERIDFVHRPHTGEHTESQRVLRIERRS